MANEWTANTVKFEPNEFSSTDRIDPRNPDYAFLQGNMAIEFKMSCAVLKDGVFHHSYKEPHVPPPPVSSDPTEDPALTLENYKNRLILNHLNHWKNAHAIVALAGQDGKIAVSDVAIPAAVEKSQEQMDVEAVQSAIQNYLKETASYAVQLKITKSPDITTKDLQDAYGVIKTTLQTAYDNGFKLYSLVPKDLPEPPA